MHGADDRDLEGAVSGPGRPRIAGRHRGSKPRVLTPQVEARILSWTRKPPTDGTTHWSTRRLGEKLGVPHTIVARAWKRAGLAAASVGTLPAIDRSRFRSEGGGDHWAVPRPAAARRRLLRGRKDGHSSAGSARPDSAAVARPRGASRLRIRSPWDAVALRGARDAERPRAGQDGRAPHQRRVRRVPRPDRDAPNRATREIHIIADNLSAHKTAKVTDVLGRPSECADALHADLCVLAEPSRALVRQSEAGSASERHLYLSHGSRPEVAPLYHQDNERAKPVRWAYADPAGRIA